MKTISKAAAAVLELLTEGLTNPCSDSEGSSRKIDNAKGSFMAVHVSRLGANHYSVAHYYEQNGDLCPDPDMEFIKLNGYWLALSIEHYGRRDVAIKCEMKEDGSLAPTHTSAAQMRSQSSFCAEWMRNIKSQQGLRPKRRSVKTESATA